MKKKIVAMVTSLVLVAALAVGGTLAWLTDTTETVTNTFTVNSTGVAASLTEALVEKDTDGMYTATNERTTTGNVYDDVYPGAILPKDPTVSVDEGSEACYVYLAVYNDLEDAVIKNSEDTVGVNDGWTVVNGVTNDKVTLYAFTGAVTETSDIPALFNKVVIDSDIEDVTALASAKIVVKGYAHQSTGVEVSTANAEALAWANAITWTAS